MPCSNCDGELSPGAKFCSNCGTKVEPKVSVEKPTKQSCDTLCAVYGTGVSEVRILLVGHTGHGKSETGNSLLGRKGFEAQRSFYSVTKTCQREVANRFGRRLEIIDTPGFYDTSRDVKFIYRELTKTVALTIPGFNAILFVLEPTRFSEEMVKTVDIFFEFFGGNIEDFGYVVLTYTKNIEQRDTFLKGDGRSHHEQIPKLDELIRRCKQKVLIIDNKAEEQSVEYQARIIIDIIIEENRKQKQPYFTNECTENVTNLANNYNKYPNLPKGTSWMPKWRKGRDIGGEYKDIDFTPPPSIDEDHGESEKSHQDEDKTNSKNYNDFKTNVEKDSRLTDLIIEFVLVGFGHVLKAIAGKVACYIGSYLGRN